MEDEFYAYLERRRADLLSSIGLMEEGRIGTGERRDGGPWIDTTAESIARNKEYVAEIDKILAKRDSAAA